MKKLILMFALMLALPVVSSALTVDQPDGSLPIPAGSFYLVQWTPGPATLFNIYLSYDNGLTWTKPLNGLTKHSGNTYDWTLPIPLKNKTKCKIRVNGYNNTGAKVESGVSGLFVIDVLNITFPNGPADSLDAGHIKTITWNTATQAIVTDTKLSYTVDNGLTWLPIATISGNPGTYDWTVPQLAKTAKIKVDLKNGTSLVATDTSDAGFKIEVTPKTNANANGTYYMPYMDYDYFTLPGVLNTHVFGQALNGSGSFDHSTFVSSQVPPPSGATNVPYSISPDGQIVAGNARGIISDDDNMILLAELGKGKILGAGLAIKSTAGLTTAALDGTYVVGQGGVNLSGGGWVGRLTATFDGAAGNGNIHCDDMTNGCAFVDLPITYTVDPATGQITDSLGQQGMVTADGKVFSLVDFNIADNTISFLVGMKTSSGGLSDATMAGKFIAATFGISDTHGPWVDIFQVKLDGAGGGSGTELYTSWPPLTPTHPVSYAVAADGSLTLGPIQGLVMGNGQGFLAVDIAAGESSLTFGLKKAK